ncbi:MAG: hypothetical protein JNM99_06970 [Verrucomicrobiaceae bacterium]|nr:hypothetical protein [Verrucomicrobiaceae bacterium]
MDQSFTQTLFSPINTFVYGFLLGAVFLVMSLYSHWKTKREFKRYKLHLSDKLELDARQLQDSNKERTRLSQENEHMRLQVARLSERNDNKLQRELEIMARAEKHMLINAPGFAPAWELAKANALTQIQSEESGQSFPQKIFRKLMGTGGQGAVVALPADAASKSAEGSSSSSQPPAA